ncbi:MAG: CYTH domain-containing protein [Treponema sp.]|nr:CYTH domain-containing protein [Treponema sp.]
MYEIELKAHVAERSAVEAALNSFATYCASYEKRDTYYSIPQCPFNDDTHGAQACAKTPYAEARRQDAVYCRIRKMTRKTSSTSERETSITFTYKRKELRTSESGIVIEVNDEKECTLSDEAALVSFLHDAGGNVAYTKEKIGALWNARTDAGDAHIELCTVPPLGDFLEVELVCKTDGSETVAAAQHAIMQIFKTCGIPESALEKRYYSDMLNERKAEK